MTLFLRVLSYRSATSREEKQSVKPRIFSCIGDIALAIGPEFDKYLTPVLEMAADLSAQPEGAYCYELCDYGCRMRSGILDACSGILGGFKNTSKSSIWSACLRRRATSTCCGR
ncbi:Importin subunit beta-1 [Linum grandiflorum]